MDHGPRHQSNKFRTGWAEEGIPGSLRETQKQREGLPRGRTGVLHQEQETGGQWDVISHLGLAFETSSPLVQLLLH